MKRLSHKLMLIAVSLYFVMSESISITQKIPDYPQFCLLAAHNDDVFQTFRREPIYQSIVETLQSNKSGLYFVQEIMQRYPHLLPFFEKICREDMIGGPIQFHFPEIGTLSSTVLRYVKIVGDLQREFGDLKDFAIVEIGGGFGGQCKMINDITGFESYTIIDIPECIPLIKKYLSHFSIPNSTLINNNELKSSVDCDLVISNYAFSEIDRGEQMHYIAMVINAATRGYIIYNHFPQINPFSIDEFVALLRNQKKQVKIIHESQGLVGDIIIWHSY